MSAILLTGDRYKVDSLYQWDKDQDLVITGLSLSLKPEIHFTNENMDRAIVKQSEMDDAGIITVRVPNSLLQVATPITVYVCGYEGDTFKTYYTFVIQVIRRTKPADYTLTVSDEEVYSFNALENKISNVIASNTQLESKLKSTYNRAITEIKTSNQTLENNVRGNNQVLENNVKTSNQQLQDLLTKAYEENLKAFNTKSAETLEKCESNITETTDQLIAQIANIVAHNNDTEGNSELIDIRVGANGVIYPSAGEAVRTQIASLLDFKGNSYASWLAIGDSVTVGYNNKNYSYADIISEKYNIPMKKDAITGTNISVDSATFGVAMSGRYSNNLDDYALITVMGGVNDFSHSVPLGVFDPTATTRDTFYNGVNVLASGLLEKYPNSKIIFMTSNIDNAILGGYRNSLGKTWEDYVNALETVCNYYSLPLYRIDKLCGFNGNTRGIVTDDLATGDTIHPVTKGHTKLASAVNNAIDFTDPFSLFGKGRLIVTQSLKNIGLSATLSSIRELLTVKAVYENVEFEISNYTLQGNIETGDQEFTISYRNLNPVKVTFIVGDGDKPSYEVLYRLPESLTFTEDDTTLDTGVNWRNNHTRYTIKMTLKGNITKNMPIMSVGNGQYPVQNDYPFLQASIDYNFLTLYTSASKQFVLRKDNINSDMSFPLDTTTLFIVVGEKVSLYTIIDSEIAWISDEYEHGSTITDGRTLKFNIGSGFVGTISEFTVYNGALARGDIEKLI